MPSRILVIDDNPLDTELVRRALRRLPAPAGPAEVVNARDWTEALPYLDGAAELDLVLLDFNLPGLSGLEILGELSKGLHPPVVMMTGQDDIRTAVETLRAGAYDYVPKSAEWGEAVRLTVERVLSRVALERELAEARTRLEAYARDLENKVEIRTAVVRAQAAEIEALYLKAEAAARVKAEIVANVSHELRTPLVVILGCVELLEERLPADVAPEADQMLHRVRSQAEHLTGLIESLLTLHRLADGSEGIERARFEVTGLLEELRGQTEVLNADRGLALRWNRPAESIEIEHDREKLRTIGYHLITNAIKFTPAGHVDVTLEATPGGGVVLSVADSGVGLPVQAQEVIFEDFRQADGSSTRRYDGIGLGLGIVRRYAELLGGIVRFMSTPGEGTTVRVELPPLPPRATPASQTGASDGRSFRSSQ